MNEDIKIKDDIRYLVGTMDKVPMFLTRDYKNPKKLKFMLSDNVSIALKAADLDTAKSMLATYKSDTGDDRGFAFLKLRVSYQLIDD